MSLWVAEVESNCQQNVMHVAFTSWMAQDECRSGVILPPFPCAFFLQMLFMQLLPLEWHLVCWAKLQANPCSTWESCPSHCLRLYDSIRSSMVSFPISLSSCLTERAEIRIVRGKSPTPKAPKQPMIVSRNGFSNLHCCYTKWN